MIVLLGATAAAREIEEHLRNRGIALVHMETQVEKSLLTAPSVVLDLSHPSSSIKFAPLRQWCEQRGIPYLRLERPETQVPVSSQIYPVFDWEELLRKLEQRVMDFRRQKGRPATVFVTTGSHQLETITQSPLARLSRLVVRVLPEGRLVQKCQDLGIPPRDIVAMQGPFSKEINRILFKFYGADLLLTRDSGPAGGTDTKISAALALGLEIVLLKRTRASAGLTVNSVEEVLVWLNTNVLEAEKLCQENI